MNRYDDAYAVAAAIEGQGNRLKAVGRAVGVVALIIGAFSLLVVMRSFEPVPQMSAFDARIGAASSFVMGIGGVLFAVIAGVYGSSLIRGGTMLCAQGQLLYAQLDTAINTSPFLDPQEKRVALGLERSVPATQAVSALTCQRCSTVNPLTNQFCESCGRPLERQPA